MYNILAQYATAGLVRLIVEVSRSHTIGQTHTHSQGRTPLDE